MSTMATIKWRIQERETGEEIETFDTLHDAEKELFYYEKEDKQNGEFIENFYEIKGYLEGK